MLKLINKAFSLLIILILLFCVFMVDGYIEHKQIEKEINDFKNRAQYIYELDKVRYYKVVKQYDYEDTSNIVSRPNDKNVGTTGDIFVSDINPLGDFALTKWMADICWIGHCGMVYDKKGTKTIEVVGNSTKEENVVKLWDNIWGQKSSSTKICCRVKEIDDERRNILIEESNKIIGGKYNYTFVFGNKKDFYCLEVVSYLYNQINININSDYFFSTGVDFITNENTYIIYYSESIYENGIKYTNVYFLSEE